LIDGRIIKFLLPSGENISGDNNKVNIFKKELYDDVNALSGIHRLRNIFKKILDDYIIDEPVKIE